MSVLFLTIRAFDRQGEVIRDVQDIALERTSLLNQFILVSERVQSDLFLMAVFRFMAVPGPEVSRIHNDLEHGLSRMGVIYGQILYKWPLCDDEKTPSETDGGSPLYAFIKETRQATDAVSKNPSFGVLLVRSAALPFARFRQLLNQFLDYQQRQIAQAEFESRQTVQTVKTMTLLISCLTALLAILVTGYIGRRFISRPVGAMTDQMKRLAHGIFQST